MQLLDKECAEACATTLIGAVETDSSVFVQLLSLVVNAETAEDGTEQHSETDRIIEQRAYELLRSLERLPRTSETGEVDYSKITSRTKECDPPARSEIGKLGSRFALDIVNCKHKLQSVFENGEPCASLFATGLMHNRIFIY